MGEPVNRSDTTELAGDLLDCAARLRDMGQDGWAQDCEHIAAKLAERRSLAPTHEKTKEHFRKAREYTSEALRRLRRDQ